MRVKQSIKKLEDAGLYAKYYNHYKGVRGGSHYHDVVYMGKFVYGAYFITPRTNGKYNCEWYVDKQSGPSEKFEVKNITLTKAVDIIIENVKPGINIIDPRPEPTSGPCYY
jgi:hypothetical protein